MKTGNEHIISKLEYDVTFLGFRPDNQQNVIGEMHRNSIMPVLNNVLDSLIGDNKHLLVDKLEIDLGTIKLKEFEQKFKKVLSEKLSDGLSKAAYEQVNGMSTSEGLGTFADENQPILLSETGHAFENFVFFLRNGYFNWNFNQSTKTSPEQLFESIIVNAGENIHSRLIVLLGQNRQMRQRFLKQIRIDIILNWLSQWPMAAIKPLLNDLEQCYVFLLKEDRNSSKLNKKLLLFLVDFLLVEHAKENSIHSSSVYKKINSSDIFQRQDLSAFLTLEEMIDMHQQYVKISNTTKPPIMFMAIVAGLKQLSERDSSFSPPKNRLTTKNEQFDTDMPEQGSGLKKTDSDIPEASADEQLFESEDDNEPERAIEIPNAGLLLLWPYYKNLFNDFNLLEKGNFINLQAMEKAVFLLNYMVSGKAAANENNLLIGKIITGMEIKEVLNSEFPLSNNEKEECDNLLKAAIKNWSALGTTYIEGFRETFLTRTALANKNKGAWLFRIERKGVDVLLDRMPFGMSMIKFGWLDYLINVEW